MSGDIGLSFARDEEALNVIPDDAVLSRFSDTRAGYDHGSPEFPRAEEDADTERNEDDAAALEDAANSQDDGDARDDNATDDLMAKAASLLDMTVEQIQQTPESVLKRFIEKAEAESEAKSEKPDKKSGKKDEDEDEFEETYDSLEEDQDPDDSDSDDFDMDYIDPDTARAIEKVTEKFNAEIKRLQSKLREVETTSAVSSFDNEMSKLGPEYHDLFGEGTSITLDPMSDHAKNREALREEMDRITLGYHAMNEKPPSRPEIFKKALRSAFGDQYEAITKKQISTAIKDRRGRFISRPALSEGDDGDREARAIANLGARMRERGLY